MQDVSFSSPLQSAFMSSDIKGMFHKIMDLPHSSVGKESVCSAGDLGLIPGLGRSPGEGNGNPLQYSCLENPMDRGGYSAWGHKSGTQLSD